MKAEIATDMRRQGADDSNARTIAEKAERCFLMLLSLEDDRDARCA